MVDFIKITNTGINPEVFLNNPNLSFTDRIDTITGEIIECRKYATYRGMKFFITAKGVTGISGSLHKYYNEGEHNYDDFTMMKLMNTIEDLQFRFKLDPSSVFLNSIEFGVNIEVPFNPDNFINHLVTHNYTQFNTEKTASKNYASVAYSQFILKIYNKGLQFGQDKNILRFEVKIVRMEKIKGYGIRTLNDLLVPDKLMAIKSMLLDHFKEIIYYDAKIDLKSLSQLERDLLRDGYNPKFWMEHKKKSGSNASKKLRKYQELISNYGKSNYPIIVKLISDKWDSLLQGTVEPARNSNGIPEESEYKKVRDLTGTNERECTEKVREITGIKVRDITALPFELPARILSEENTSINNLSIGEELVIPGISKQCIVTGLDISMQKGTSRFLSSTGIRYYMQNDPEVYKNLLDRLTSTWKKESLEKKISEIAHSIRNSHHSKRIHTKKAINKLCSKPALFNNYELVSQHKKNIANQ